LIKSDEKDAMSQRKENDGKKRTENKTKMREMAVGRSKLKDSVGE
jgi:hypothetical protein